MNNDELCSGGDDLESQPLHLKENSTSQTLHIS